MINIEEFAKVEIRIGTVLSAMKVPEADRLIQLIFDFGPDERSDGGRLQGEAKDKGGEILKQVQDDKEEEIASSSRSVGTSRKDDIERLPELVENYPGRDVRQIMSAIAPFYEDPGELVGKQIAVCVNLEPRKFKGYVSQGMILATGDEATPISLLVPEKKVEAGSKIH